MPTLAQLIPDPNVLLQLEPEELGGMILHAIATRERPSENFLVQSLEYDLFEATRPPPYPTSIRERVGAALREAFCWLEGQALIIPAADINGRNGWRVLSRRAARIATEDEWQSYRQASLLPKQLLHPQLVDAVYFAFARGDYSTAIFQAFKAVEVRVREAARLTAADTGTRLMRKAFDKDGGPLADDSAEEGEREALAHLFAGAIGSYKNPHSHRSVAITDPTDAVEMIMLASHLLRIVDARDPARRSPAGAPG